RSAAHAGRRTPSPHTSHAVYLDEARSPSRPSPRLSATTSISSWCSRERGGVFLIVNTLRTSAEPGGPVPDGRHCRSVEPVGRAAPPLATPGGLRHPDRFVDRLRRGGSIDPDGPAS